MKVLYVFNVNKNIFNVNKNIFYVNKNTFNVNKNIFNVNKNIFNVNKNIFSSCCLGRINTEACAHELVARVGCCRSLVHLAG